MAQLTENTEPPAGPTVMQRAHESGLRRVLGFLKNRFKDPEKAEENVRHAALLYLREWEKVYKQGVAESPSTVDRTILDIRRDTVVQIMAELGRPPVKG
jgi:predicted RNA polymerase sigma factor